MNYGFAHSICFTLCFTLLSFISTSVSADSSQEDKRMFNLKRIVSILAHDSMGGRATSSLHESKAANFISNEVIKQSKQRPQLHSFTFMLENKNEVMHSKNIYCFINNKSKKTILLGAHYDHLGLGEEKSLSYGQKGQIHNGADDNASGVALQLELLRTINMWNNTQYNYLFVWYSAHEIGLYGSQAFKEFAVKNFPPLEMVINFDMVGRLDTRERILSVYGYNSIKQLDTFLTSNRNPFKVWINEDNLISFTDAGTFTKSGIKAISFTTGIHDDYHKASDDAETLNYEGLTEITNYVEAFLKQINYN